MDNWMKNAKLFIGFDILIPVNVAGTMISNVTQEVVWFVKGRFITKGYRVKPQDCQLIARKIDSLELSEIKEIGRFRWVVNEDDRKEVVHELKSFAEMDDLPGCIERVLANKGIYFGPQSHFEDGSVRTPNEVEG